MNLARQKAFIIHIIYMAIIFGLGYVCIKYVLPLLMPFVIGLIIAVVLRKPIDHLHKLFRIKRSLVSILVLIVFYGVVVLVIILIGGRIFSFVKDLFGRLPDLYSQSLEPAFRSITDNLMEQFPQIQPYVEDISNTTFEYVKNASASVLSTITELAGRLPSLLIRLIFAIVSSFFFTIDYYRIFDFILNQFSEPKQAMLVHLKDNGIGTLGKFIKAYSAIISITFIELAIGFLILRIPNAALFAALIAVIDILPILGTGAVLLPWSITAFLLGNTKIGIGMLVVYIIITAVRQAIEPKIIGQQIGLHPLITLLLMFVGAQLMGVLGLLLLPIIATILKKMNDEGTLSLFKYSNSTSDHS